MLAQLVLVPLLALFLWGYVAMRPAGRRGLDILVFDLVVVVLAVALSLAAGWWVAAWQPGGGNVWRTVMTTVTTFHVFPAVLLAGWYIRRRVFAADR